MSKLKIAGVWSGILEVELESWTVLRVREEIGRRSNSSPGSINLITGGKLLKDGDESLAQLGIKNNAKILASRVCSAEEGTSFSNELLAEEERSKRLSRVKAAAAAISKRNAGGSSLHEDQYIELEDQNGRPVNLGSETDKGAIMMGLMLHTNAKQLINNKNYKDALEVLTMGEEAFSLCDPKVLEFVDNPPILLIDMVWCYFMLKDITWLSVAGERLQKARKGIERSYGKDSSRVKLLQGGRQPEIALVLRLELLEGVVAYHTGQFNKSRKFLNSAQQKLNQLHVPDESLSLVMSMGFNEQEAKRALRMSNHDVGSAIDFLVEQKEKIKQKREEDIQHHKDILEQKKYGKTPLNKPVDLQKLSVLASIGYAKYLGAEALRRNENDFQKALDDLTNPDMNSSIQVTIEARKRKRQQISTQSFIEELVRMGFERPRVVEAFRTGARTMEQAMQQLLTPSNPEGGSDNNTVPSSNVAEGSSSASVPDNTGEAEETIEDEGLPDEPRVEENRDKEMEDELADELANVDALTDYDIEVTKEAEAIDEYMALLASAGNY